MISGIGGYGGSTSSDGFGGFGSPEGMAEDAVASGAMTEAEAYGGFDTPETDAIDGGSGGGSGNLMGNYAVPTGNFKSGVNITQQVKDNSIYANAVKSVMTAMVPGLSMVQNLGRLLGSQIGSPPNEMMSQVTLDQGLRDQYSGLGTSLATDMGHPHTGGPMLGSPAFANESMMSVPMSGFGAQLGIATARDPHTGLNMGPGRPGEPGDVNPFSGVAYADPGDPYIRKKRGTEIVGMIGP